jgi:predicted O-methyltransferase YrrM
VDRLALQPGTPFFTAELDPERAAAARDLFAHDEDVHVLEGDWRELLPPEAPFDLVFFDAAKQRRPREDGQLVVGLLAPGGIASSTTSRQATPGRTRCEHTGCSIPTWPRRRS